MKLTLHLYTADAMLACLRDRSNWWFKHASAMYQWLGRHVTPYVHCNLQTKHHILDVSVWGHRKWKVRHYPAKPSLSCAGQGRIGFRDWKTWEDHRMTPVRATLDLFHFPFTPGVCSCVTESARMIGIQERAKTPFDLYLLLTSTELDHGFVLQRPEDRSTA